MVKAIIEIDDNANRVVNIIKAKYGLNDKSEAIQMIIIGYGQNILEPELRPEFVKDIERLEKQKGISFKNMKHLRKIVED